MVTIEMSTTFPFNFYKAYLAPFSHNTQRSVSPNKFQSDGATDPFWKKIDLICSDEFIAIFVKNYENLQKKIEKRGRAVTVKSPNMFTLFKAMIRITNGDGRGCCLAAPTAKQHPRLGLGDQSAAALALRPTVIWPDWTLAAILNRDVSSINMVIIII